MNTSLEKTSLKKNLQGKKIPFMTHVILFPIFLIPYPLKQVLAWLFSVILFFLIPYRKKIVVENVKLAFPKKSVKEVKKIAFWSWYNSFLCVLEYSYFPYLSLRDLNKRVIFHGFQNLEQALLKKKGVLILGTHTGNGELGIYKLAKQGFPAYLIGREIKNRFVNKSLFAIREKSGLKHIKVKKSPISILRALKENKIIIFVLDQFTYRPMGIPAVFFGRTTGTDSSLAYFALKLKSPVIPACTYRSKGQVHVIFGEEIETSKPFDTMEENISFMTEKYNRWIESAISQHPSDWMWVHRRWKKFK